MTDFETTLKSFGIKPARFAEMIGKDVRTVRRWCRNGAPIEVRALLLACECSWPQNPAGRLLTLLDASGGCLEGKPDAE